MKQLYPKAKFVKLQKRKVGPNRMIQFAFVVFDNEQDCAEALNAHTEIADEKVHVSFARAQKPQSPKTIENNKQQLQQSQQKVKTPPPKKQDVELMTNSIYVGQLPELVNENDIKKLFPKATNVEVIPATPKKTGVRPGHAFVTFADDASAAAAIKQGPTLTLKNTQLKINYRTKRPQPPVAQKRPVEEEEAGPKKRKKN